MRAGAWVVLAVLLSGCAAPPAPPVREVPFDPERGPDTACRGACSHEWWNLTVEAPGTFTLRVPLPALPLEFGAREPWSDPLAWAQGITIQGAGYTRIVLEEERALLELHGGGPVEVHAHRAREPGPAGHAEDYLRARWGPEGNQTRADALPLAGEGKVLAVRLAYDAVGGHCHRHAAYATPHDGAAWLHGRDEGACV